MEDRLECPECGADVSSSDDLVEGPEVAELEVEADEGGGIHLFRNRDLFLCKNCKRPLGVGR